MGCFLLGLFLATVMFAVATTDLALPSLAHPKVGERTTVSYRIPSTHVLQELDEKSLYWRVRFELPVGHKVTPRDLSLLRALEEHRRPPDLGFAIGLAALLIALFVFASQAIRILVRGGYLLRVQLLLLLPVVVLLAIAKAVFVLTPFSVFWIPLAALSMTWAILHSRLAGLTVAAVGAVAAGTLFPLDWGLMIALAAQGFVPPLLMDSVRKRRTPSVAWVGGAVAAVVAYVGFHFLSQGMLPAEDLSDFRRSGLLAVVGAAAVSPIIVFLLKPVFQWLLGVVSQNKLLHLSDMDHPLLHELASDAPGTWQHTLSMANMAEAVGNAIGVDGKLVRVGAYYHDVGKLTNPKNFAENLESGDRSPHLDMRPEESAAAIFEHVTEGVRLARQHKLPYAVREFIFTHHGDGLLEFFWHKCQEQGNSRALPEDAFHYPGIPPQTKETAILAIVDAMEAASKSLKEPDAGGIDNLVRRIVFGKLQAGQLDQAGLTGADLATITTTVQEILRSQFHVRPEYPWQKQEREREARAAATEPPESVARDTSPGPEGRAPKPPVEEAVPKARPREPSPSPDVAAPVPGQAAPDTASSVDAAPARLKPELVPNDTIREPAPPGSKDGPTGGGP
ncbi:MAG: HDIG domain-containing metalloprotein [bacterium]